MCNLIVTNHILSFLEQSPFELHYLMCSNIQFSKISEHISEHVMRQGCYSIIIEIQPLKFYQPVEQITWQKCYLIKIDKQENQISSLIEQILDGENQWKLEPATFPLTPG